MQISLKVFSKRRATAPAPFGLPHNMPPSEVFIPICTTSNQNAPWQEIVLFLPLVCVASDEKCNILIPGPTFLRENEPL